MAHVDFDGPVVWKKSSEEEEKEKEEEEFKSVSKKCKNGEETHPLLLCCDFHSQSIYKSHVYHRTLSQKEDHI